MEINLVQFGLWIVVSIVLCVVVLRLVRNNRRLEQRLNQYRGIYLHKQGGTTMVPNADSYHLFSPNGGRDWYALGPNNEILGSAEEIHPRLLAHIDGMYTLTNHVKKYGPIGSKGRVTSAEKRLLRSIGFTVNILPTQA